MVQVSDVSSSSTMSPPPASQQREQQQLLQRKINHDAIMSNCWSLHETQATRNNNFWKAQQAQALDEVEETSDTLGESDDEDYDDDSSSSEDEDDEDEDDIDELQDEAETRMAKALAQAAFSKHPAPEASNNAALYRLLLQSSWHEVTKRCRRRRRRPAQQKNGSPPRPLKRARRSSLLVPPSATNTNTNTNTNTTTTTTVQPQQQQQQQQQLVPNTALVLREDASVAMRLSISAPLLLVATAATATTEPMSKLCPTAVTTIAGKENAIKPDDCLAQLFLAKNASTSCSTKNNQSMRIRYHQASELTNFFVPLTSAALEAYTADLTRAVHQQDVAALRHWHQVLRSEQRSVDASSSSSQQTTTRGTAAAAQHSLWHAGNKFGETIVHAACRRGSTEVLSFLLQHGAPLRVCCDAYRTPLHDACWTSTNHPGPILDLILDACPDLLYILDARGFTPLQYVPRAQWSVWTDYLTQRGADRLRPMTLDIGV
jgi:Ankyrin repeats (3 copies)